MKAIKTKINLILSFAVLLLIPVVLITIIVNIRFKSVSENEKYSMSEKLVSLVAGDMADKFDEMVYTGKYLTASAPVKSYMGGDGGQEQLVSTMLKDLAGSNEYLLAVAVYNASGEMLPASIGYADGIYLQQRSLDDLKKLSAQGYGFSEIEIGALSNHSSGVIRCVMSVMDEGKMLGYCEEYFDMRVFESTLSAVNGGGEYEVMISDRDGELSTSPFDNTVAIDNFDGLSEVKKDIGNALSDWKSVSSSYKTSNGEKMYIFGGGISSTKNSKDKTWGVFLIISSEKIEATANAFYDQKRTATFFIFVLSMILWVVYVIRFTKPVSDIYNLFVKYNSGEKSARYSSAGNGDMERIGHSINFLMDTIDEVELRYSTLVDMTDNIIFEYNVAKDSIVFSDNFNSKFSFRAKSLKFEDSFFVNCMVQRKEKAQFDEFVDKLKNGESVQGEFRFKTIYGDYAWYLVRSVSAKDSKGNVTKIMGAMVDIDRAKRREENLLKKANYDSLTHVFNRSTFEVNLSNEYDLSQMRKTKIAVLFIDLDDFKHFNDTFGHALGDEVLTFTAETLKTLVGSNGFVGRYGGDEFVVCYGETNSTDEAGELAELIIEKLGEGFDGESAQGHFEVRCSIGISYFSDQSLDADSVIQDADEAMYTVKKKGKSDYSYFTNPRR